MKSGFDAPIGAFLLELQVHRSECLRRISRELLEIAFVQSHDCRKRGVKGCRRILCMGRSRGPRISGKRRMRTSACALTQNESFPPPCEGR